jgi:hypothetical protein
LADERGVIYPDNFIVIPSVGSRATVVAALATLKPGVTETYVHPAKDTPELRAMCPDWEQRVDDHAWLTEPDGLKALADANGVKLIGYRALRDAMR